MDMFPLLDMVSGIVAAAAPENHVHLLHNAAKVDVEALRALALPWPGGGQ
jgi:REP element-mobilizing transposase RayT